MDWLDEKLDSLGNKLHNMPLRRALAVYIVICIFIVVILYAVTMAFCSSWKHVIWSPYIDNKEQVSLNLVVPAYDYSKLSGTDAFLIRAIEFIQTWSVFIYTIGGILGTSFLFYKKKLKEPLRILKYATGQVGKNNLDFEIYYDNKDEMGDLCHSFDLMRKQLIANNQKMWDMMEEQKRLNAAFAHDLRTPLTVLRGYTDFLQEYIPEGKISEEKLLSTLLMMSGHIERLERYSNTMKEINSFEEIPIHPVQMDYSELLEKVQEVIRVMDGKNGIAVRLTDIRKEGSKEMYLDESILMEVFENLMSNALRYTVKEIRITLEIEEKENKLLLSVADDGKGFSAKGLTMAAKPYYKDNTESNSTHFGIGLYICKLLCEKHGGWLSVSNSMTHGAIITAAFHTGKL